VICIHEHPENWIGAHLPKLEIPVFAGEPLDWQPFWDCFSAAIDTNPSLTGVQKLSSLWAQLRDETSRVIAGFPLTNLTLWPCWRILMVNQSKLFVPTFKPFWIYLSQLISQILPWHMYVSCNLLINHQSDCTHCWLQWYSMKTAREIWPEAIPVLSGLCWSCRLPFVIRLKTSAFSSQQGNPTAAFYTSLHQKPHGKRESSNKLSCVFCKSNHTALNCEGHKDVPSSVEIIKQQRLCYNCLTHHRVSQWNSRNHCCKCGNKHHTSICSDPKQNTSETKPPTPSSTASNTAPPIVETTSLTTLARRTAIKNTTCLLKKAIATVVRTDLQMKANILFDKGSQRSFLTEKLARELAIHSWNHQSVILWCWQANTQTHGHSRYPNQNIYRRNSVTHSTCNSYYCHPYFQSPGFRCPHLKGLPLAHPVIAAENFESRYWLVQTITGT